MLSLSALGQPLSLPQDLVDTASPAFSIRVRYNPAFDGGSKYVMQLRGQTDAGTSGIEAWSTGRFGGDFVCGRDPEFTFTKDPNNTCVALVAAPVIGHPNALGAFIGNPDGLALRAESGAGTALNARSFSDAGSGVPVALIQSTTRQPGLRVDTQGNFVGIADAVVATSASSNGVVGRSNSSVASGVYGENTNFGYGVAARSGGLPLLVENTGNGGDLAAVMFGDVNVFGTVTAQAKQFVIDHPQDPGNKVLRHVAVESSEYKTVYDGVATLDAAGKAVIGLPGWLEALCGDFRYQLTPIGAAADLYVSKEVARGTFEIAGGTPGLRVSWQLTGLRKDAYATRFPVVVEEVKPADQRGKYLAPRAFGAGAVRVGPPLGPVSVPAVPAPVRSSEFRHVR